MLLLETGMAGTFIAFDLILFFVFWELVLVPMYFLIGIWGVAEPRVRGDQVLPVHAVRVDLHAAGLPGACSSDRTPGAGTRSTCSQLQEFARRRRVHARRSSSWSFGAVALGFAVKVPMWPFHTWLPDAHTEAPTIGSVLLAGIMLKMGTYGFIRIALPMLPDGAQKYAPWIGLLAAIAIVYAALACLAQKDLKRLIAFSSVGHMGFVMLGIATLTTIGIKAAIFGMVAHGVITGMLFFCVGSIYDRYHTREIAEIGGGMAQKMPYLGGHLRVRLDRVARAAGPRRVLGRGHGAALVVQPDAEAGLSIGLFRGFMVAGGIGTILTAGYFLWMLQRVNLGTLPDQWKEQRLPRRRSRSSGSRGCRCDRRSSSLGLFPRLIFGVTDEAVDGLMPACSSGRD